MIFPLEITFHTVQTSNSKELTERNAVLAVTGMGKGYDVQEWETFLLQGWHEYIVGLDGSWKRDLRISRDLPVHRMQRRPRHRCIIDTAAG